MIITEYYFCLVVRGARKCCDERKLEEGTLDPKKDAKDSLSFSLSLSKEARVIKFATWYCYRVV